MQIKYKILSVDPSSHSIVVRFYTDTVTEEVLASFKNPDGTAVKEEDGSIKHCISDFNVNIWQVPPPTGAELEKYILSHAPVDAFKLKEKILNPEVDTSMSELLKLVNVEKSIPLEDLEKQKQAALEQISE